MDIYNTTLVAWPQDAALDPDTQSYVSYLALVRVNVTTFPEALRGPLPAALTDVEFVATNLTEIPDDLDTRWPTITVFYIERSLLTQFPMVLLRMNIFQMSLLGNRIETAPIDAAEYLPYVLVLSNNLIKQLPDTIASRFPMALLFLENTEISGPLPSWLTDGVGVSDIAFLWGSPVCDGLNTTASAVPISCVVPSEFAAGAYPLELVDSNRRPQST
ncbi:hypothetical protein PINS_up012542 [Pythium insidiosum]|nr:hypothetical protein PINS_up012542 [Pythium insidiosum]